MAGAAEPPAAGEPTPALLCAAWNPVFSVTYGLYSISGGTDWPVWFCCRYSWISAAALTELTTAWIA